MDFRRLTYLSVDRHDQQQEQVTPFLGIWKARDIEKTPLYFERALEEKEAVQKKCDYYYPFGMNIKALSFQRPAATARMETTTRTTQASEEILFQDYEGSGIYTRESGEVQVEDGRLQIADTDNGTYEAGSSSITLTTVAGEDYEMYFEIEPTLLSTRGEGEPAASLYIDGQHIAGHTDGVYAHTFTATGTTTTILFQNTGGSAEGLVATYLDNLTITHHYTKTDTLERMVHTGEVTGLGNRFKFNGKEFQTDFDIGWYDYGARFYDPQIGRFMQVDPSADSYVGWTPYNYVGNNPINIIDPDGRDWFEINGKVKWRNWEGDHTTKKGKTYKSLGKNVLVVTHRRNKKGKEKLNSASFALYLEKDKTGPSAIIQGNTVPTDAEGFGTLAEGLYSAETKARSNGQEGILVNGGEGLPTVDGNPNNPKNEGKDKSEHVMDAIWFHAGNSARKSLKTLSGRNISEGCLTGRCGAGSYSEYQSFMEEAKGFKGNLYLRSVPVGRTRATTKTHKWVRTGLFFGRLKLVPINQSTTGK